MHLAQVIQIGNKQWTMRIRYHTNREEKPLGRDPTCVLNDGLCRNASRCGSEASYEPIDCSLIDRLHSGMASCERTEPGKPADIEFGRIALVADRREMRSDTVHLPAKRSATKALNHPRIFEIQFQHRSLSIAGVPGTSRAR